jgi:hypothetical protein
VDAPDKSERDLFANPDNFKVGAIPQATPSLPPKRGRKSELKIKGPFTPPIPLSLLTAAARTGSLNAVMGVAFLWLKLVKEGKVPEEMNPNIPTTLPPTIFTSRGSRAYGFGPDHKKAALPHMEKAGLIVVNRDGRRGLDPIVTLIVPPNPFHD